MLAEFDSRLRQEFFSSPLRPFRFLGLQAAYPMCSRASFDGGEAAKTWSWPLISI